MRRPTSITLSYHAVVARQIEYARSRGVPWGISECGYNITDATMNYQYRAFGVPGMGFKRGLAEDLVIAPYAALMALMVNPAIACSNLEEMESLGYAGMYGFYEAVDFTRSRVPPGQTHKVVQSFMAHHQGMALLSLAYVLLNRPMQRRFESDPSLSATLVLLQEKMPRNTPFYPHTGEIQGVHKTTGEPCSLMRLYRMLYESIELRHAPFIGWITDLSAPDRLFHFPFSLPFMEPPFGVPVLTIIMGATMFIQQKMSPPMGDPAQAKMMMMMPIVFTVMFLNLPSGRVLYWFVNNLLGIG